MACHSWLLKHNASVWEQDMWMWKVFAQHYITGTEAWIELYMTQNNLFINKSLFLFPPCSWLPFPPASSSTLECCQVQVVWAGGRSSRRPRCPRHLFRCKTFLFKCTPCAPFRLHFVSNSFLVFFLGLHQVMIISALNQRLNPLHHWHSTCICSYFCIAG